MLSRRQYRPKCTEKTYAGQSRSIVFSTIIEHHHAGLEAQQMLQGADRLQPLETDPSLGVERLCLIRPKTAGQRIAATPEGSGHHGHTLTRWSVSNSH
jgi:hypothetical protein